VIARIGLTMKQDELFVTDFYTYHSGPAQRKVPAISVVSYRILSE